MESGYGVFRKAYETMLRNDPHAKGSIDRLLMRQMRLVDEASYSALYKKTPSVPPQIKRHECFLFAQQFCREGERETIRETVNFTKQMADSVNTPMNRMLFGGTEREMIQRKTDWCTDISRVGATLLQCVGIPARMVYLANRKKAYHGHAVTEAYYCGKYGVIDFLHGFCFYEDEPLDVFTLLHAPELVQKTVGAENEDYCRLYDAAAVSEYDPTNPKNRYPVSGCNQYYLAISNQNHADGQWLMGEDSSRSASFCSEEDI